jgi:hypothetical protein
MYKGMAALAKRNLNSDLDFGLGVFDEVIAGLLEVLVCLAPRPSRVT